MTGYKLIMPNFRDFANNFTCSFGTTDNHPQDFEIIELPVVNLKFPENAITVDRSDVHISVHVENIVCNLEFSTECSYLMLTNIEKG